jgi:Domain of unknown function (DUF4114)
MKTLFVKVLTGAAAASGLLLASSPAFAFDPTPFKTFLHTESQKLDVDKVAFQKLDPTKLNLMYDHEVKAYFIGEGAGYRNQLGVTVTGNTQIADTILFDDIVCLTDECSANKNYRGSNQASATVDKGGLKIGEVANLGVIKAGSSLDFWLNQDGFGVNNATRWYGDTAKNSDGKQHLMTYEYGNYLVLAWEDLTGGGDLDYNDVVFAVDVGEANLKKISEESGVKQTPEPATAAALLGLSALASRVRRKRNAQ